MRIIAIRGRNLASLAAPFEIDLTRGPLAGTGLFAITGDMGAGKSTVLDALCLALYGAFPRADPETRERILDPSNEEVQASDPRNILRRGAGEGFAQVDFIGQDGTGYRATWAVRRARAKAAGRLQQVERKLEMLDGAANVAVGVRDVLAAVETRTGLTYNQFCRTVLLAQGEFDAFLLASETDRADLLEKITGTEVYSRISRCVHEEKDERDRQIRDRRMAQSGIELLDDAGRQSLIAEQAEKADAVQQAEVAIAELVKRRQRADDIVKARVNVAAAEQARAAAEDRWHAAADRRAELDRLNAVEPLRPKVDLLVKCRERVGAADAASANALADEAAAIIAYEGALARAMTADERTRAAREEVGRFRPLWEQAAALDIQMTAAQAESNVADAAHVSAVTQAEHQHAEVTACRKRASDIATERDQTEASLKPRANHQRLHVRVERINELFADHDKLTVGVANAAEERRSAENAVDDLELHSKAAVDAIAGMSSEIEGLLTELAERRAKLNALGLDKLELRDAALRKLEAALTRARETARQRDASKTARNKAIEEAAAARKVAQSAADRVAESEQALKEASARRSEIAQLADLAEATVSEASQTLRASLIEDEPCPVCGATEHPYAHNDQVAAQLVHSIRQRRAEHDQTLRLASDAMETSKGDRAVAAARQKAAEASIADATARYDDAMAALSNVLPSMADLSVPSGIELQDLPGTDASDVPLQTFLSAIAGVNAARGEIETTQQTAAQLRMEICGRETRLAELTNAVAETEAARQDYTARLANLRTNVAERQTECRSLEAQLVQNRDALSPFLELAGLCAGDLERDRHKAQRQIAGLISDFAGLLDARAQIATRIEQAERALQQASSQAAVANSDLQRCGQEAEQRRTATERLTAKRAALLDGEPTRTHRERFERTCDQAETELSSLREALHAAEIQLERYREALAAKRDEHLAAGQHADAALANLQDALVGLDLHEAVIRELLDVPSETRKALANEIDALKTDLGEVRIALQTRRSDLAAFDADDGEALVDEIAALERELGQLTPQRTALQERLAVLRDTLKRDAETVARLAEALREIERLEVELNVWRAVHDAIGSSDGAKFKRYAQGLTLRQLVGLANQQLHALNPRYQLRQGTTSNLALDVIDREMGEEIRSPRSLSGGERFLVSLALALALAGLEGRQSFVDTVFIDEGFGSLDRDTLDVVIEALEALQSQGRKVGLVTHVPAMMERIAVQVRVEKRGGGRSVVRLQAGTNQSMVVLDQTVPRAARE